MKFRTLGKTGVSVSSLGFGCMRLPIIDNDTSKINYDEASAMVRKAIDDGVNYIDTAWPYHGMMSEPFVAKVLKDGYREKVNLATKLPIWLVKKEEDFDYYLNEQLKKLEVDYIDFYLVHAINKDRWSAIAPLGLTNFLDRAKADGRIKHVGFSYHDNASFFNEAVDAYDWDFCQIQLNYIDTNHQQGIEGLNYAAEKGLGVIIMEPLRGGKLIQVPAEVQTLFDSNSVKRPPVEWAFRWLLDNEKISLILSGMSDMNQVQENLKIFDESDVNCMSDEEHEIMDKAADTFNQRIKVNCTACNYCMPCPVGVNIPRNFAYYNEYHRFDGESHRNNMINSYNNLDDESKATSCIECGACESACPQHISIIEDLKKVTQELGK